VDGALLEDVTISNITMRDIVNDPIFLRLGSRMRGPDGTPVGALRRVNISNIIVYNASGNNACTISGIPGHDIEDVSLNNIHIYYQGGGTKEQSEREVPENESKYPEPGMFGVSPAYGLFVRHAKNIKIDDVEFSYLKPDYRPAFVFDDVQGIYMNHVVAQKETGESPLRMQNSSGLSVYQSPGIEAQQARQN
jgi:hypothetical protein